MSQLNLSVLHYLFFGVLSDILHLSASTITQLFLHVFYTWKFQCFSNRRELPEKLGVTANFGLENV